MMVIASKQTPTPFQSTMKHNVLFTPTSFIHQLNCQNVSYLQK